jgi:hypothetical protein
MWKLHLKFVWNDNLTPLKVPDLYLSDVRFAHSFPKSPCSLHPPLFYHNTRIWSYPNWCDLKSVQLYVLSYPFDSVKFYVIIFCHEGDGVSRVTLETNEQILHQININLVLLEVSDCRFTQTLSVTSTSKMNLKQF